MPASASYSDSEILSVLFENGIVDPDGVRHIMNKKRTEKLLSYHNHKIWKGDDGRWRIRESISQSLLLSATDLHGSHFTQENRSFQYLSVISQAI
jgi:hypothetical protein